MNNVGDTILIIMFYSRVIGIIEWWLVSLLLMEVVICKDAKTVNTARILNTPLSVRIRMFKKSWKSNFYKGNFIVFFVSIFAIVSLVSDMWLGRMPRAPYTWTMVSLFLPLGIYLTYSSKGYEITLFKKFQLFLMDQHD